MMNVYILLLLNVVCSIGLSEMDGIRLNNNDALSFGLAVFGIGMGIGAMIVLVIPCLFEDVKYEKPREYKIVYANINAISSEEEVSDLSDVGDDAFKGNFKANLIV